MQQINSTLVHRILPPEQPLGDLHPAIIFIHGRGADEEDLLGLSGHLDDRFLSIAVRAPHRFEFGGYTWYEILDMGGKPDVKMFKESYDKLSQFIHDALEQYPIDPHRLFLFGFSMGTVMSYALALTQPHLFAGVVANSGYLAEETHLSYQWNEIAGRNLFIAHGRQDPVVPVQAAQRARLLFENAQARLKYKEYEMAHQISDESLADIAGWLKQHIQSPIDHHHAPE